MDLDSVDCADSIPATATLFHINQFMHKKSLNLTVNGHREALQVAPRTRLLDALRWSLTTVNATFDYTFHWGDSSARARIGVKNLTDERAPLADRFFGYFADAHRDLGRGYYLDLRLKF